MARGAHGGRARPPSEPQNERAQRKKDTLHLWSSNLYRNVVVVVKAAAA
jgi:hypothetical protein